MENPEEILQCLEEFSKIKPKDIPRELDEYLCFVAKTGNPVYQWPVIKCLFRQKLINVISDFYETCPTVDIPPCLNVDLFNYNTMKTFILEKLDTFVAAPFTVQRICELLTTPRKQYNRIDKYMRALEKNILVVSTTEPVDINPSPVTVYRSTENGDNNNQAIVNGLESDHLSSASSDDTPNINIEEMDDTPPHTTTPNSPQSTWPTPNRTHTHNTIAQSQTVHNNLAITTTSAEDTDQEEDTASSAEGSTSDEGGTAQAEASVIVVEGVFAGVEEEAAGSSEEEEEDEERLLLSVRAKEDEIKNDLNTASNIVAKCSTVPEEDNVPVVNDFESTQAATETEALQPCKEDTNDTVQPPEVVPIESTDNVSVEDVLIIQTTDNGDDKEEKVETALRKDDDSDNTINKIDIKTNILETPTETTPTENLDTFTKEHDSIISAESTKTDEPEDTNILEPTSDIDINVKSDREDAQINHQRVENSEIIDKESDVEAYKSCAIAEEAHKLETEVTQMENIPAIEIDEKLDEKQSENKEEVDESVANGEEVANDEEDERMEVDDDILEATSASL